MYVPYAGTQPAARAVGPSSNGDLRTADGRNRRYRLYVPASYSGRPVPLLVALHGGMGTAAQFEANSGFNGLAEANTFIVAYPDGVGALPNDSGPQTWNGGYCCGRAARDVIDDVEFIRKLVDTLETQYAIDSTRIFAAGHSNGAILAYGLACELADRIVAIGVQSGSLGVDECRPQQPVSVIHIHGTADTNHPIGGGKGSGFAGVTFRPAADAVVAFARLDACASPPMTFTAATNRDLRVTSWSSCTADTAVQFVVVDGAAHAWMGHHATSALGAAFVGKPYPDLDASRAIWSFLATHPRR